MKYLIFAAIAGIVLCACSKNASPADQTHNRTITDSLMIYALQQSNGKSLILSKSFKTGELDTMYDGYSPFASSLRLVYIKGTNVIFTKLDGKSKVVGTFTQPADPSLSIDSKSICVIDKPADKYQLLSLDTLLNKTVLYESVNKLAYPSFSSDGT